MLEIKQVDIEVIEQNKVLNGEDICKYYFIEEASELTKELIKSMRGQENKAELIKELADVYYTLSMLVQEYGVTAEEINEGIKFKETRAKKALGIHRI